MDRHTSKILILKEFKKILEVYLTISARYVLKC